MGDLQSVIEKVARLRKLATSTNVHEAAAAAAAADKLMQEHGIAEAQLEASGEKPAEPIAEDGDPLATWIGRTPQWQLSLCVQLVRHYGCSSYGQDFTRLVGGTYLRGYRTRVIGRRSDIETVRYMYSWLSVEIERLAQLQRGQGRSYMNSYRHGAVAGVMTALRESKAAAKKEAEAHAGTSAALVLIDNRASEALAERDRLHTDLKSGGRIGGASDWGAHEAGKEAGRTLAAQHAGLASGTSGRALKG